jgi:hypothetical protein
MERRLWTSGYPQSNWYDAAPYCDHADDDDIDLRGCGVSDVLWSGLRQAIDNYQRLRTASRVSVAAPSGANSAMCK